ncbi:MAG: hypothetical protein LBH74_03435 [Nitrososphaerota archaeon]|jgi:hypothetical protein|nr:hypothetical protein [Nitrososphaerota archaeon]
MDCHTGYFDIILSPPPNNGSQSVASITLPDDENVEAAPFMLYLTTGLTATLAVCLVGTHRYIKHNGK